MICSLLMGSCLIISSERRGFEFVTRKITSAVARIVKGFDHELQLGNLDAKRDWGYAPDYVAAMWMMLQQPEADDFVVASEETHSVREFVDRAFSLVGLDWQKYVVVNPALYRPAEVHLLCGDATKAHQVLGWQPNVKFEELVKIMVESDIKALEARANP